MELFCGNKFKILNTQHFIGWKVSTINTQQLRNTIDLVFRAIVRCLFSHRGGHKRSPRNLKIELITWLCVYMVYVDRAPQIVESCNPVLENM